MKPKKFQNFRGAHAKLKRAKTHRAALETEISKFLALKPYKIAFDEESPEGFQKFRVTSVEPLPDEIACIAGDFLHNLRSALDHLCVDLVLFNKRGTSGVTFPSSDTPDGFRELLIKKGGIEKCGDYAIKKIGALEVHIGGKGEIIRHLHKSDVIDKHFDIIGLGSKFCPYTVTIDVPKERVGETIRLPEVIFPVSGTKDDGTMDRRLADPLVQVKPDYDASFEISFREPAVFANQSIPTLCKNLYNSVESIINFFSGDSVFRPSA